MSANPFRVFKQQLQQNIDAVIQHSFNGRLYLVDIDKDLLWQTYINTYPEDIRQEFNCNSCKQFVRNYGAIVGIAPDNTIMSIWDMDIEQVADEYKPVVLAMTAIIRANSRIKDFFIEEFAKLGTDSNIQLLPDKTTIEWQHFFYQLPSRFVWNRAMRNATGLATMPGFLGEMRQTKEVFQRSLTELTVQATETVLELIASNAIYRGEEFKGLLEAFLAAQKEYADLPQNVRGIYCWKRVDVKSALYKIRNTAIGTLLTDLSKGEELDKAVFAYESKLDPTRYRRPRPVLTPRMIEALKETLNEAGLTPSLQRRLATIDDLDVRNVLFIDRTNIATTTGGVDIFGQLEQSVVVNPRTLSRVSEMKLDDFIEKVLPGLESIELLLENRHESNLVSLVGPVNAESPNLLKWDNPFSWSYNNAVSDAIRERVKAAGGNIEGKLRISLSWNTYTDLDLRVNQPDEDSVWYNRRTSKIGGQLDVDANAGGSRTLTPVENIIYPYETKLPGGSYPVIVTNFSNRSPQNPYTVEIEYGGEIYRFEGETHKTDERTVICYIVYHPQEDTITITAGKLPLQKGHAPVESKNVWNLNTYRWHRVNSVMLSPNYWAETGIGNKHYFFMLNEAYQKGIIRGIFNEFIHEDLHRQHRKAFEALGSMMEVKVEENIPQLSGVGFSSTKPETFYLRTSSKNVQQIIKVSV